MKTQKTRHAKELQLRSVNMKLHQDLKIFGKRQLAVLAHKHLTFPFQMIQL